MAGENEGAQTTTEAPENTAQSVATAGQGGGTLLSTDPANAAGGTDTKEGKTDGAADTGAKDGDKGDDKGGKEGDGNTDADKTPIEYTDFTVPDGMQIDDALLGQFKPIAQELGLNQDQAQKFVSMYAEKVNADQKAWADQVASWADESRSDTEFGGAKFDENLGTAIKAVQAFGSPKMLDLLNTTGLGNHPEMLRFCLRVGAALGEDKTLTPGAASSRQLSAAEVLYGNSTKS